MKKIFYLAILFFIFNLSPNKLFAQSDDYTYHKAFVKDKLRIYRVVEFRESGIYIDEKQAAALKVFEGVVLADFNEIGERFFVVVTNISQGTCGYNGFAIVSIDEKINIKVSPKIGENQCVGESLDISISWNKKYQRIISVSGYEYNLSLGKWNTNSVRKIKRQKK